MLIIPATDHGGGIVGNARAGFRLCGQLRVLAAAAAQEQQNDEDHDRQQDEDARDFGSLVICFLRFGCFVHKILRSAASAA